LTGDSGTVRTDAVTGGLMSDQWYYAWRDERLGPYTGRQLQELAEDGKIQPSDTVWQDNVEHGVVAARVRNLFPSAGEAQSQTAPTAEVDSAAAESAADQQPTSRTPAATQTNLSQPKSKKGHATAIRGAVLVSQDGMRVTYRKKCPKCGSEDASKNSMPIRNGITRANFFCRKCRKLMPVEIQGTGK
jgi:RNA polymerase subunit RPABC4/transcription elongation factor Spt4